MSGYCGYSMSNNAVSAYRCGEMPLSKGRKKLSGNWIKVIKQWNV